VNGRISIVLLNTKANPCVYCVMVAYLLLKKSNVERHFFTNRKKFNSEF
jgi:hypothetical protein